MSNLRKKSELESELQTRRAVLRTLVAEYTDMLKSRTTLSQSQMNNFFGRVSSELMVYSSLLWFLGESESIEPLPTMLEKMAKGELKFEEGNND